MKPVTTQVSTSSRPMWTWKESGGSPPSIRVFRTALAFWPAPPATVALMISRPGCCRLAISKSLRSPAASPPVVHHEKISSLCAPCARALTATTDRAAPIHHDLTGLRIADLLSRTLGFDQPSGRCSDQASVGRRTGPPGQSTSTGINNLVPRGDAASTPASGSSDGPCDNTARARIPVADDAGPVRRAGSPQRAAAGPGAAGGGAAGPL